MNRCRSFLITLFAVLLVIIIGGRPDTQVLSLAAQVDGDSRLLLPLLLKPGDPPPPPPSEELIPAGATWKYLDDGSDPGSGWRGTTFDDSSWASGMAQLGYGDGDEQTTISYGADPANKPLTSYFRHTFSVTDPTAYERLALRLLKDDGAVVYLNGTEIFRINLPLDTVTDTTPALVDALETEETTFFATAVDAGLLQAGTNVLAAEVHQVDPANEDLSFDLQLTVVDPLTATTGPRNIILFIGDGMGYEQIRAASVYQYGSEDGLFMQTLPYTSTMSTYSADEDTTDSAAAATAMATGVKVNSNVISVALPGDAHELETLLEYFKAHCKSVGLVTTTTMTHATPAAFGAHETSRGNFEEIGVDYFNQTRPHLLFGGGAHGITPVQATAAGYTVVTNRSELQALGPSADLMVSGQFGDDNLPWEYDDYIGEDDEYATLPHLTEMVSAAIELLETDPDGFFLMVEGGRIDHAGHSNNLERIIFETLEFDASIQLAYNWAAARNDTLILVTADHETGGLTVIDNNGAGNFPTVTWLEDGHTAVNVPVFGWGHNANLVPAVVNNVDIHDLIRAGGAECSG